VQPTPTNELRTTRGVEAALAASEERLQLATEGTGVGIYDVNIASGASVWSPRTFEIMGVAPGPGGAATFEQWRIAVHPDDWPRLEAEHAQAMEACSAWRAEYRIIRADTGEVRWIETNGRFTRLADGSPRSVGIVADVTERKAIEARLRESEAQLRRAQEAGGIGSYQWSMRDGTGVISDTMRRVVGAAPADRYRFEDVFAPILPDDMPQVLATVEAIRRGARRRETNYRIRRPGDGAIRWIRDIGQLELDGEGRPHRWVGIIQDVTERTEAELALRESERRFRVLAETVPTFVWFASPDGTLRYLNARWYEYTGQTPESALPDGWADVVHPDDVALAGGTWQASVASGTSYEVECRLRRHDGVYRWYIARAEPVRDESGAITEWFGSTTDIHDHKLAETALRRLNESLEAEVAERTEALRQSQKLESMGQLTGGVAHDFNNLLTPIVGSLDLLQRRGVGDERDARLIDAALQSAERAKTLVQRLLAFARRQTLQAVAVDLAVLSQGMAALIASTLGPKVRLTLDVAPGLPPVKADPNQIEMALLNLCVNARDAMPDGGTLTVAAAREHLVPADLAAGAYVRLTVADTGVGMDDATRERAIEPFFSTKGIGKGTGLGLSMVHGLVAQLGGGLTIESTLGEGTRVHLRLPVADEVTSPIAAAKPAATSDGAGTVLLVDDEELVRASTAEMLRDLGYLVVEAPTAEAALAMASGGLAFDLLVSDHLMPGMSGSELARLLRASRPDLRVLIVSGYAEAEGLAADLPRLTKPFRSAELAESLVGLRA
jgi:PAS domain S-box-containing protein